MVRVDLQHLPKTRHGILEPALEAGELRLQEADFCAFGGQTPGRLDMPRSLRLVAEPDMHHGQVRPDRRLVRGQRRRALELRLRVVEQPDLQGGEPVIERAHRLAVLGGRRRLSRAAGGEAAGGGEAASRGPSRRDRRFLHPHSHPHRHGLPGTAPLPGSESPAGDGHRRRRRMIAGSRARGAAPAAPGATRPEGKHQSPPSAGVDGPGRPDSHAGARDAVRPRNARAASDAPPLRLPRCRSGTAVAAPVAHGRAADFACPAFVFTRWHERCNSWSARASGRPGPR